MIVRELPEGNERRWSYSSGSFENASECVWVETQILTPKLSGSEKHKADYYRYICESDPDEKTINKSQQCYDKAFEIAKDKISSSSSLYLGLILNYSVFLNDIKKQTQKAIEISQKACNEAKDINDSDAPGIISLILENIQFWTDEC